MVNRGKKKKKRERKKYVMSSFFFFFFFSRRPGKRKNEKMKRIEGEIGESLLQAHKDGLIMIF